jgi:hypothetical protein
MRYYEDEKERKISPARYVKAARQFKVILCGTFTLPRPL